MRWGWWREGARDDEHRQVVADWMEQHGQPGWAAWFRSREREHERLARFFGPRGEDGSIERVLCGMSPVSVPRTALDGPWFVALHVVYRGTGTFDFEELCEIPCMAYLSELIVHVHSLEQAHPPEREAVLDPADLGPLREQLRGLWLFDARLAPGTLASLVHLERLRLTPRAGRWAHPTLRDLVLAEPPEPEASFDLPALRTLDLDLEDRTEQTVGAMLAQLPSIEEIELDAEALPYVARVRAEGGLSRLRVLRLWGEGEEIDGVQIERVAPLTRRSARLTGDWIVERGVVLAP